MLGALHAGLAATPAFIDALLKHDLLESFVLDIELDGRCAEPPGRLLHDQRGARCAALDGAALGKLHDEGHLEPMYMVIASTAHLRDLIERRNRRM